MKGGKEANKEGMKPVGQSIDMRKKKREEETESRARWSVNTRKKERGKEKLKRCDA